MDILKSLTILTAIFALTIGGCAKKNSEAFSSSSETTSEEVRISSSSDISSESSISSSSQEMSSSDSKIESSSEISSSSELPSSSESSSSSVPIEHHYADEWSTDENYHWKACIDEGYEDLYLEKAAHTFTSKIVEPTYEAVGYTEYTCSVCSYSYKDDYQPALEHHYADEWSYDDDHHWRNCIDDNYEDLKHEYAAHNLVLTDDAEEIYASEGYYPYICKKCGYTTTSSSLLVYGSYYESLVSWTDGEDLKNQLNAIIRDGYQPLSYTKSSNKQNYDTNINADHAKDDFEYLDVIYSNQHTFKNDTNKGWQREHAWCASLMCGSTTGNAINHLGRATDFHNLFAANASGNQSRGNKNYGNADTSSSYYETKFIINGGADGYSYDNVTFEPGDIDKGRLARAIFYMATMYKDDEYDSVNGILMKGLQIVEDPVVYVPGNNCAFAIGHLSDLLAWSEDTPVDYLEMQHNVSVYTDADNIDGHAQGNRNPYVDYPELVDYVFGNKKNEGGTLASLTPAANQLNCENDDVSHYAIKEAKRNYGYSEQLTASDYHIVEVYNNFTYGETTTVVTNSFDGHTFSESDGNYVDAIISTPINAITYRIILNPMGICNSGILDITTAGINKKSPDTNQSVSYGGVPFYFNFSTSFTTVTTDGMTITNSSGGGITIGSNPRPLTKLTISSQNSYTVDSLYIKAMAGNASSFYSLAVKVGDTVVANFGITDNANWKVFGSALDEPLTGQISFVFTGTSSLKINSIAFNALSV